MECVIFLDAIGGTRCIPEKMGGGQKLHNRNGGEACDARAPWANRGKYFFLAEAYRCAFETELAKRIQKSRIGKIIFL